MSIIALGVMPYITASIVVQLAAALAPSLAALRKEGESGHHQQYTRYGTVLLTAIEGYFIAVGLETLGQSEGIAAVVDPGMMFRVGAVISIVGGTLFLMWLGEQITSRGIGNGVSLIIMAGILAQLPRSFAQMFAGSRRIDGRRHDRRGHRRRDHHHRFHQLHGTRTAPRARPVSKRARRSAA